MNSYASYVSTLPSLALANPPQTHLKRNSNAPQTPLRPETSRFYIGPGFGAVAYIATLATLALWQAWSTQTHHKLTSNAPQTPLRPDTPRFYVGPGFCLIATHSYVSYVSILPSLVPANTPQTHPKRTCRFYIDPGFGLIATFNWVSYVSILPSLVPTKTPQTQLKRTSNASQT